MKNTSIKYALLLTLTISGLLLTSCNKKTETTGEIIETEEQKSTEEPSEETFTEPTEELTTEEETEQPTTNADRGEAVGESVFNDTYIQYGKNDPSLEGYEVTITEELNTEMYVVKDYDYRKLDNEKAGKISPAEIGAYVTVTGKTSNGWYEIQCGIVKGYLPPEILSTENPLPPADLDEVNPETGKTTQETLDDFHDLMDDPALDEILGPGYEGVEIEYGGTAPDYGKVTGRDWD